MRGWAVGGRAGALAVLFIGTCCTLAPDCHAPAGCRQARCPAASRRCSPCCLPTFCSASHPRHSHNQEMNIFVEVYMSSTCKNHNKNLMFQYCPAAERAAAADGYEPGAAAGGGAQHDGGYSQPGGTLRALRLLRWLRALGLLGAARTGRAWSCWGCTTLFCRSVAGPDSLGYQRVLWQRHPCGGLQRAAQRSTCQGGALLAATNPAAC